MWSIACHDAGQVSSRLPATFVLWTTSKWADPTAPASRWSRGGTLSASM
jgi:hypothetical protein